MSRIGRKPVPLPKGVTAQIDGHKITVKGPKGEISRTLNSEMALSLEDSTVLVKRPSDEARHKALHGLTPPRRYGNALLCHDLLERGEPSRVGRTVAQYPRALAQRLLVSIDARCMRRVEAEHEPIEEPASPARTFEKEPIHQRRQPNDAQSFAERRLAARRLAVDSHNPPFTRCTIATGPDPKRAVPRRDDRRDGPPQIRSLASPVRPAIDLGQFSAAQAAARGKK